LGFVFCISFGVHSNFAKLCQGLEGFVESAFGAGHHALGGAQVGQRVLCEQSRFQAAGAAETPVAVGHFGDEESFGFGLRLVLGEEAGAQSIEVGRVFAGATSCLE
jgi:hypothetical protein